MKILNIDKKLWGNKLESNPYIILFMALFSAVAGVFAGGQGVYNFIVGSGLPENLPIVLYSILTAWLYLVAETIIGTNNVGVIIGRSISTLFVLLLSFTFGIIVVILLTIVIIAFIISGFAKSGSRSGSSEESGDWMYTTDENGVEIKVYKNKGDNYYSDDYGRRYRDIGGRNVERMD